MKKIYRIILYTAGMISLALGLSLSTKLNLGVSALTSFPFMISQVYELNFGNVTLVYYVILNIIQIIMHICRKKYRSILNDILQFILSIIFTRVLNVFGSLLPEFSNMYVRLPMYLVSATFVGIGASLAIDTKGVPNPCDGLVATFSETLNINLGNMKNILDFIGVILTCSVSFILTSKIIGIGIGTIISMLCVGRVIYIFNKLFLNKINKLL